MKELIVVLPKNLEATFDLQADDLDALLQKIRKEVTSHVPDVETPAGRKAITSRAAGVSSTKVSWDAAGKGLVAGIKLKTAGIDSSRKKMRDFLDALRDEIKAPLNDWNHREAERVKAEILAMEMEAAKFEAWEMHAAWLQQQDLDRREAVLKAAEEKIEKEKAELQAVADREARDKRIREEAVEAEKTASADRLRVAEAATKLAENRRREEKGRGVRLRKDAADLAERRKKEAVEAERKRAAQVVADKKAADKKRADDRAVQAAVHSDIVADLESAGVPSSIGRDVVRAVATGKVPGLVINYRAVDERLQRVSS
jgi:hypothetical protein